MNDPVFEKKEILTLRRSRRDIAAKPIQIRFTQLWQLMVNKNICSPFNNDSFHLCITPRLLIHLSLLKHETKTVLFVIFRFGLTQQLEFHEAVLCQRRVQTIIYTCRFTHQFPNLIGTFPGQFWTNILFFKALNDLITMIPIILLLLLFQRCLTLCLICMFSVNKIKMYTNLIKLFHLSIDIILFIFKILCKYYNIDDVIFPNIIIIIFGNITWKNKQSNLVNPALFLSGNLLFGQNFIVWKFI